MKKVLGFIGILIFGWVSLTLLTPTEIFATTTVRLIPSVIQTQLNGTFTIDVIVEDVSNLMAGDIRLSFDNNKIQGEGITEGTNFLTKNNGSAFFPQKDITNGSISVAFAILGGNPFGVSGSGTIFSVLFKTISATPTSQITYDLVDLRDTVPNSISIPNENQFPAQILPVSVSAGSVTVYDANGGFVGTYTTIQAGVNACPVGGTVSALAGTYNEAVYINKKITLIGVGTPTITASGLVETNTVTFDGTSTNEAIISGFIITGATGNYPNGSGIYCNNGSPIIINNTISGNSWDGIYCDYSFPTITTNTISGNLWDGIYCSSSSPIISNNTIIGNMYVGIECCYTSAPEITNHNITSNNLNGIYCWENSSPTITNNTISENTDGILCDSSSPIITNNTISGNISSGIVYSSSSPNLTNNIITTNSYGIFGDINSNPVIDYNCVWGNKQENYYKCAPGTYNISADPQFIGGGDFHLQPTSPCINKGTNTAQGLPLIDKDGKPRIFNDIVDMGAYEFQGTPTLKEWTFMVYLDGDNNLEDWAIDDFLEMAQVGSNDKINIVVQMDRINGYDVQYNDWDICHRFLIKKDVEPYEENAIPDWGDGQGGREVNMGSPDTLTDFINWAITNYPANKYALILWNHGGGWRAPTLKEEKPQKAVCRDDTDGDYLYMSEVRNAIESASTTAHLNLIGFDACLMGMVEVAYALRGLCDVMVASEESEPENGWPYDTILSNLAGTPTMSAKELGKVIVTRYGQYYESHEEHDTTQSAVDMSKLDNLAAAIDIFADSMGTSTNWQRVKEARGTLSAYGEQDNYHGVDIYFFAHKVQSFVSDTNVQNAANDLKGTLSSAIIANYRGSKRGTDTAYGSYGLAIYFPRDSNTYNSDSNHYAYEEGNATYTVSYVDDHRWDDFIRRFYTSLLTTGSLTITSNPSGATIYLDGTNTDTITPATLTGITPGTHTIKLTKQGYCDWFGTVTVTAGTTTLLTATLTLITGSISINSNPSGASIFFDGGPQGTTPTILGGITPGTHTIKLTKQGYCDWFGTVTVPVIVGSITYLYVTLTPSSELHHFRFGTITDKRINEPFSIQVIAENKLGCILTDFYGTATLNDTTKTIFPQMISFSQGIGSISVIINIPGLAVQIIVAKDGITGISNSFSVLIPKDKRYFQEKDNIRIDVPAYSVVEDYILEIDQFSAQDNFEILLANDRFNQDPTICQIQTSVHKFTIYNATQTLELTKNATITGTFSYTDTEIKQIDERKLKVYRLDSGRPQWIEVPSCVYPSINKITVQIPQMGIYILAGPVIANNFNNFVVFPNPLKKSRDGSTIEFLGLPEDVTICIYDISGNLVKYIENQTASWQWEAGKEVDSGIYIYIIEDKNGNQITGKIGVIR